MELIIQLNGWWINILTPCLSLTVNGSETIDSHSLVTGLVESSETRACSQWQTKGLSSQGPADGGFCHKGRRMFVWHYYFLVVTERSSTLHDSVFDVAAIDVLHVDEVDWRHECCCLRCDVTRSHRRAGPYCCRMLCIWQAVANPYMWLMLSRQVLYLT